MTVQKSPKSLERKEIAISLLIANESNPNEMTEQEFNLLYDNIERMGVTDPVLVRPHPTEAGKYRIVGGHHRVEAASLVGYTSVPCTVITDPSFSEDEEKFQMVRHNIIKGKMNPKKFMALYQSLADQYSESVAAEMFGFASEEEFRKMVANTAKALPPEMKQSFLDASKEIKTIDDLAAVLNKLFTTYGDTVPYGYMIFDYGKADHVWLRMDKNQKKDMIAFGNLCRENNRTVDKAMTVVLQLIAQGNLSNDAFWEQFLALPEVSLDDGQKHHLPTEEFLSTLGFDGAL